MPLQAWSAYLTWLQCHSLLRWLMKRSKSWLTQPRSSLDCISTSRITKKICWEAKLPKVLQIHAWHLKCAKRRVVILLIWVRLVHRSPACSIHLKRKAKSQATQRWSNQGCLANTQPPWPLSKKSLSSPASIAFLASPKTMHSTQRALFKSCSQWRRAITINRRRGASGRLRLPVMLMSSFEQQEVG